jgi:multisubunit Na+/H+ antiporter MnhE subunit
MKKSAGVIVSGVLAILGSVASIAFGGFAVLLAILFRTNPDLVAQQQTVPMPFSFTAVLFVEAAVFVAIGIFGIVAAIGLLRLRNWARISFVVFGGILCFLCIVGVFMTLLIMLVLPQSLPSDPNVPPGILTAVFVFYLVVELLVGALAVWWLVYFTRRNIKEQFMTPAEASLSLRGPLSVTIIAWLLLVGGALSVLYLPFSFPIVLFGVVFHGWMARIVMVVYAGVGLLAGAGMLRWRPRAHSVAVGIYIFGLVNAISYYIIPGAFERMNDAFLEMVPQAQGSQVLPSDIFYKFGMLIGVLGAAVALWFLLTRRKAFLDACKTPVEAVGASNSTLS